MAPQSLRVDPIYPGPGDVEPSVVEFPRENLRFVEKLGDCQFGEVRIKLASVKMMKSVNQNKMTRY